MAQPVPGKDPVPERWQRGNRNIKKRPKQKHTCYAENACEAQLLCRRSYCVIERVFGPHLAVKEGAQLRVEAEAKLAT